MDKAMSHRILNAGAMVVMQLQRQLNLDVKTVQPRRILLLLRQSPNAGTFGCELVLAQILRGVKGGARHPGTPAAVPEASYPRQNHRSPWVDRSQSSARAPLISNCTAPRCSMMTSMMTSDKAKNRGSLNRLNISPILLRGRATRTAAKGSKTQPPRLLSQSWTHAGRKRWRYNGGFCLCPIQGTPSFGRLLTELPSANGQPRFPGPLPRVGAVAKIGVYASRS